MPRINYMTGKWYFNCDTNVMLYRRWFNCSSSFSHCKTKVPPVSTIKSKSTTAQSRSQAICGRRFVPVRTRPVVIGRGSSLLITFASDEAITSMGFRFTYKARTISTHPSCTCDISHVIHRKHAQYTRTRTHHAHFVVILLLKDSSSLRDMTKYDIKVRNDVKRVS